MLRMRAVHLPGVVLGMEQGGVAGPSRAGWWWRWYPRWVRSRPGRAVLAVIVLAEVSVVQWPPNHTQMLGCCFPLSRARAGPRTLLYAVVREGGVPVLFLFDGDAAKWDGWEKAGTLVGQVYVVLQPQSCGLLGPVVSTWSVWVDPHGVDWSTLAPGELAALDAEFRRGFPGDRPNIQPEYLAVVAAHGLSGGETSSISWWWLLHDAVIAGLFLDLVPLAMLRRVLAERAEDWEMNMRARGLCPRCGYDTRGTNGTCPECGDSQELPGLRGPAARAGPPGPGRASRSPPCA